MSDVVCIAFVVVFFCVNAILSRFEFAFFSLNKSEFQKLKSNSDSSSQKVVKLFESSDMLLSTILLSKILFNLLIVFSSFYLLLRMIDNVALIVVSMIFLGLIIALFTEILPRTFGDNMQLQYVKKSIVFVLFIYYIMYPLSYVLTAIIRMTTKSSSDKKFDISFDDLSKALELSSDDDVKDNEMDMLEGIIRFRDKRAEDIMVSRADMVVIDIATNFANVVDYIVDAGFSRIPVFEDNPDNIKGILYVKDLLPNLDKGENFDWQKLMRPAYFVPGTKRIDDLLEDFRANKNHMAILIDEYGGTMGLVTMEDILEEIVGDISDEYDEDQLPSYYIAPDGSYVFEGRTSIEDFIEATGVPEEDFEKIQEDVDTIAGLMLELKGDFPKRKEIINFMDYSFQAEEVDQRRILKVRFNPLNTNQEELQ